MPKILEQLDLRTDSIVDEATRDSMQGVEEYLQGQVILQGEWKFYELNFNSAVSNFKYAHGFKFVPTDIIVTSIQGDQRVLFNNENFNFKDLDISVSGPVKIRFFAGRYEDSRGNLTIDPHPTVSSEQLSADLDGGFATDVYLPIQLADGGAA